MWVNPFIVSVRFFACFPVRASINREITGHIHPQSLRSCADIGFGIETGPSLPDLPTMRTAGSLWLLSHLPQNAYNDSAPINSNSEKTFHAKSPKRTSSTTGSESVRSMGKNGSPHELPTEHSMNILITGGAGYVGSHAARLLAKSGHEIWVYDNLSGGHREAVAEGRLIVGDLADRAKLIDVMRQHHIEAVMHFAAFIEVGESVIDPSKYYDNNIGGTCSLLGAMQTAGVKKIVFSSTTATYGIPEKLPITENEPQKPINPYGYTKLVIEQALADYSRAYGWGYAALRYFNAAGASPDGDIGEDHHPETHLIPIVLQVALGQRDHIAIFGDNYNTPDGTCVRDYIHIEDLATAHLAALSKLQPGVALRMNLGTGRGYSVREVIDACRRVTGHPIPEQIASPREGDSPELVADSTLAQKTLDWKPKYATIDQIIETAWQWHKNHPHGFASS